MGPIMRLMSGSLLALALTDVAAAATARGHQPASRATHTSAASKTTRGSSKRPSRPGAKSHKGKKAGKAKGKRGVKGVHSPVSKGDTGSGEDNTQDHLSAIKV